MKAQKGIVDNTNIDQAMRTRMDIQPDEMPSQSISQKPIEDVSEMSLEAKPVSSVQSTMHIANSRNQVVLLIGDSMVDGLGARFNDYAVKNGFEFHSVVWYGSTTRNWANTQDLQYQIEKFRPTYVIISLGTNDLGYYDFTRRSEAIQSILDRVGNIPYVWVGPLSWRKIKNRNIVNVIRERTGAERFFDSSSIVAARIDGIHPTRQGATLWVDKIVEWMGKPELNANPIEMDKPDFTTTFRHDEKHGMSYHGRR